MRKLAPFLALGVAACATSTGVETSASYVPAQHVDSYPNLPPPDQAPARQPRLKGASAVDAAAKGVIVQPDDTTMDGTTWIIANVDIRKVYRVPTAPLVPTTILLPPQESLTSAVSGSTQDFTIGTATSGTRAAITVMPNCASPHTKRFGPESDTPITPCISSQARATFLTSGGAYNFIFDVYDWTGTTLVEVNRAPPPITNHGPKPPFPSGTADALQVTPIGKFNAPWKPVAAWADAEKMVVQFRAPLPTAPGLYAGMQGEQIVNYRTVETEHAIYFVTDRRVTEAELRLDDEVVRITSGRVQEVRKASRSEDRRARRNRDR